MHFFSCTLYHNVQWRTPVTGILHCRKKFIKVLLYGYKRCFSSDVLCLQNIVSFIMLRRYTNFR